MSLRNTPTLMAVRYRFLVGTDISDAITWSMAYAAKYKCEVKFMFNGVEMVIQPITTVTDYHNEYTRRLHDGS